MGQVTNEVLDAKLDSIGLRLGKVETQVDNLPDKIDHKYLSHDVFELRMKEMDIKVASINKDIADLQRKKTLMNWMLPTISAVLGSILTFLILEYLRNAR